MIEITHDNKRYPKKEIWTIYDCFILNQGEGGEAENNGLGASSVKFQPSGGGRLEDVIEIVQVARA